MLFEQLRVEFDERYDARYARKGHEQTHNNVMCRLADQIKVAGSTVVQDFQSAAHLSDCRDEGGSERAAPCA